MDGYEPEDMERLASRLALLVSESGEADNAGRAAGNLARKLGLSGGDLKQIFLAGLRGDKAARRSRDDDAGLAREVFALRHRVTMAEAATRVALRERDALRGENNVLRTALAARRGFAQVAWTVGGTVVFAVFIGAALLFVGPDFRVDRDARGVSPLAAGSEHPAVVRASGAMLRERPDITAKTIAALPGGAHVVVKRLFWNALMQWGEIETGPTTGFVVTTDIDLK